MSDPYVTIHFFWQQASADPRQYNQQRIILSPEIYIAVDVPLKAMYIHNAEEIIKAQLSAESEVAPILTPLGMVYADNALRAAYSTLESDEEDDLEFFNGDDEIDWSEGGYKEPTNDKSLVNDLFDDYELVLENLEDDDEFPVEEMFDEEDEDLDEILWEN